MFDPRTWLAYAKWGGIAIALTASHITAYRLGGSSARTELAELRQSYAEAGQQAEKSERAQERQWSERVNEASTHAQQQINALQDDLAASGRAADSLRAAAASAARRARTNSCAPAPVAGEPDSDPIGVLADVLGRADARAGILAEQADRLRIAGESCERSYDALKP